MQDVLKYGATNRCGKIFTDTAAMAIVAYINVSVQFRLSGSAIHYLVAMNTHDYDVGDRDNENDLYRPSRDVWCILIV